MTDYKLTYFNLRVLAEPSRWVLKHAGVQFDDDRIDVTQWPELKPKLGWGQLPILTTQNQTITQSIPISFYLAKKHKLAGANDLEEAKCLEYANHVQDLRAQWSTFYREMDPEKREEIKKDLLANIFPGFMAKFTKVIEGNGGQFLVGSNVTFADFWLASFLQIWNDSLKSNVIANYPVLQKYLDGIVSIPQIKKWCAERPKTSLFGVDM